MNERSTVMLVVAWAMLLGCGGSDSSGSGQNEGGDSRDGRNHDDDGGSAATVAGAADLLHLPKGFPVPLLPAENPLTAAKIELGRRLFYDKRLSENGTQSCASCHEQAKAFTDGKGQGVGSTGEVHPRGPMSLANVAYLNVLTWGNPLMDSLERQILAPVFGTAPVELGLVDEAMMVERLRAIHFYQQAFKNAYSDDDEPITVRNVVHAFTSFERILISGRSTYDRWLYGDEDAISASAKRGYELFNGHPFECFHCHGGFNFTDAVSYAGSSSDSPRFHNTGLYNIDGKGSFPEPNRGVYEISMKPADMGRFRAPTLRNISVTAPYMHDGSIATLSDVLDHYAVGGRTIEQGPNAGVGSLSPWRSNLVLGFPLSQQDRADLMAFLESLTDDAFLTDPRFSNPWQTE